VTTLIKTLITAAAFAAIATTAFAQIAWGFSPGMAYTYGGPGKMSAIAMTGENHKAMMKHARRVPKNTTFFLDNGELYSLSGTLDPTGNFYRP
jgi:hypothetical protein